MIGQKCRITNCNNTITVRGTLCCKHRTRWQNNKTFEPSEKSKNRFQPVIRKDGYIRININGKRVLEHIYILEKFIGRKLKPNECCHHKNGNKIDNRIENLELMTRKEHQLIHRFGKKYNKFLHKFI